MSPFEWFVGMRYTRSGRGAGQRNGFISFIAALSVAGIALGVAALIVVLSVMNGFQKEVRDRMLSVLSHIEVYGNVGVPDWREVASKAKQDARIVGAAPFAAGQVVVTRDETVRGAAVRGIDPQEEPTVSDIAAQMRSGKLTDLVPGEFGIVIGRVLADQFGLLPGDKLAMIAPQGTVSPAGIIPRLKQFTVRGIFESGHYEYDSTLILAHIADAATLFRIDGASGVRLKTTDMQQAPVIAQDLANRLGRQYMVRDWSRENQVWFAAVQVEKRMMFIILTLIIAVAAFNLVSMLVMTVTDKRPDIAILRTLGASPKSILSIFMIQGSLIGLLGTLLGVALGVLIALNVGGMVGAIESLFGFKVLPPGIYVISALPSDLRLPDVAWIALISCVLALVATVYPSLRAAAVKPAEALRYE
ncbi:MAG TPA: lipoprotein-releasing ABC transporter permease subunit [Lautropia sp.]|nr:lipoprotein-releasing ABC transporter permease subunit [Lautropia sp.]